APDFLSLGGSGGAAAAPAASSDPFATNAGGAGTSNLIVRQTALEILKSQGIGFPEGASAVFNPVTSQLVVRNTQPNLDLVEAFVDANRNRGPKQIYITSKFVEVSQKNTDELGFDWLLGTIGRGNAVQAGGGSDGNSGADSTTISYPGNIASMIAGGSISPVSRGLRSGSAAISGNAIDAQINGVSGTTESPGVFSVAGVLTDPQFGVVIRALAQRKGVDLMSAPSVTTKGGQLANIEVVREFIYPTEFDPPQIPTNVGSTTGGVAGGTSSVPVTPTTPTAFATRNVGVSMEVDPTVGADGYTIDLNLAPEVIEFDGFINYGSPIYSVDTSLIGAAAGNNRVELTPNVINQPVFSVRKVKTAVTIWDGQTVVLGGLIREDVQDVEDKIPVLGDLPFVGRLFKSTVEDHFKRNLMIFVTAKMIDPAGQAINPNMQGSSATGNVGGANPLLPPVGN
ncbi:MAG: type II and III secretion system protein, partial [Prosthecobacter sp.]|nr:type II and III secretion system protein [Prosthecobacter sp.]